MSEEMCINKRHKIELDNTINIIENFKKDDNINILLKAFESLQNYIKDRDINAINTDICNSCLKAVIYTIENINNKKVIVIGCNILRILSEYENIINSELYPNFIKCIYSVTRKNNTNNEILINTIQTLLNFDIKKDNDNININNRIVIIIDVMKKNIKLNSENKTIVLNSCKVINNNYTNKRVKEYTYICLDTFIAIMKAN